MLRNRSSTAAADRKLSSQLSVDSGPHAGVRARSPCRGSPILPGRLRPGDRPAERELADGDGVSRVPVREAIRSPEAEGFVVVESPRRVVVRTPTRVDVVSRERPG